MAENLTTQFTDSTSSDATQSVYNTLLLVRSTYPLIHQVPVRKYSLKQRTGKTMIFRRFEALAERFGRIRAYESVSVLTLGDDLALRELLASTSLREAILYEISPRAVVVRSEAIDALVEELTTKGFTPGVRP